MRPTRMAAAVAVGALAALAVAAASRPGRAWAQDGAAGPSRVDFDDRLVKGQRHGTGSVYIFERQKVELRSMVKKPRSFRQRIIMTVFED